MRGYQRLTLIPIYVELARESYKILSQYEEIFRNVERSLASLNIEEAAKLELEWKLAALRHQVTKYAIVVVVFSALAVESYIYDYAARNLSDTFAKKYLDRLDLLSKWVIVPRLVTGREFPTGGQAFALLRKLVQRRNALVHNKTKPVPNDPEQYLELVEKSQNAVTEMLLLAKEAIEALGQLAEVLENLDPEEFTSIIFGSPIGKNANSQSYSFLDEFPELRLRLDYTT